MGDTVAVWYQMNHFCIDYREFKSRPPLPHIEILHLPQFLWSWCNKIYDMNKYEHMYMLIVNPY